MKNLTEIVCVLDRSGSMETIVNDAIGGFNAFLKTQQEMPGEAKMSIVLFDNEYLLLHDGKALNEIPLFDRQTFVPRGATALYDAIGKTIHAVGARLASLPEPERPNKVLFVILTDGAENASKEFSRTQINGMITHQRTVYNWEFLFLAANQDAFAVSGDLGIAKGNAMNFAYTSEGTVAAAAAINRATTRYRAMAPDGMKSDDLLADGKGETS